jgi:hypothetical protein
MTKYDAVFPRAQDGLARSIFGQSVCRPSGTVKDQYISTVRALTYRHFEREAKFISRNLNGLDQTEAKLKTVLDGKWLMHDTNNMLTSQ